MRQTEWHRREARSHREPSEALGRKRGGDQTEWSALQVQTGSELDVLRKVRAIHGVDAIAPMERIRHRNRTREIVRPLLPGYVLIEWNRDPGVYYTVREVRGVIRFLGDGNPQAIPEDQMDALLRLARYCETGKPAPAVRENGMTRIVSGPLSRATIRSVNRRAGRARIDVRLGNETHTVTVAVDIAVERPKKPGDGGE